MTRHLRHAAAAAVLCVAAPAHAETHALIMAIGNYNVPGVAPLKGVAHDVASAQEIARKLGVRDANITVMRDGQLTYSGMNDAFERLRERIAPNDDVFIYYSGHGGRSVVKDPEERCAESLITVDGEPFVDAEIEARLKGLSGKANKLVVFLDACHSGGVTTRGAKIDARFAAKYMARSGGEACQRPVNMLKRNLASRGPGSGAQNYVYIAAARDNEVSLDEAARGGVATQAWRECLAGGARDLDGSGGISAEEVQACAQQIIDRKLANVQGFTTHHISITGNSRALLAFADPKRSPAGAAAGALPAVSPASTLKDILAQRDDRRVVTLTAPTRLKIGRDRLELSVNSSHPGYLYLLMAGSDGKSFDILFPNRLDAANQIEAGRPVRLPRAEWEVTAGGPPGTTQVLAMVTDAPRDFSKLDLKPAGPFSVVDASPIAAKDIQLVTTESPAAAAPECADPLARRNLSVAKRCSNAYGAALLAVEEFQ